MDETDSTRIDNLEKKVNTMEGNSNIVHKLDEVIGLMEQDHKERRRLSKNINQALSHVDENMSLFNKNLQSLDRQINDIAESKRKTHLSDYILTYVLLGSLVIWGLVQIFM